MATSPPPSEPVPSMPSPATSPSPPAETVVGPRVVALRAMFPDYDDLILQSVLDSAAGNQDRAIDILLGMSDPDFQSETPQQQPAPQPVLSQTDLDEQFARQLVLQEQQQETQNWLQNHPDARQQQRPPAAYRSSRPQSAAASTLFPQQQGQAERPSEFQDQFNKIAESGKKTFGNIFSKVKAKFQELETGRPANQQPSTSAQQPYQPQPQTWNPPHAQPQTAAAYFDPNSERSSSPARTPPSVQGYDVCKYPPILRRNPPRFSLVPHPLASPEPPPSSSSAPSNQQQQLQPQPLPQLNTVPPPPSTSQGPPIDAGKLGLMPKRPVSLIRDPASTSAPGGAGAAAGSSAAATPQQRHLLDDDDDDGLEYAENPFEDGNAGKK
ncbi:hypothetical protein CVT25_015790 [Psilocybe cyanescens]|uniref:CUE domain-containing protein n=1 Tax=Psilocybe cyanescens TaxID=93625 RepID=A0A409X1J3_PSICY|nr:hypothetical protein CVT25_015790 [Psilocybe cyanescens]